MSFIFVNLCKLGTRGLGLLAFGLNDLFEDGLGNKDVEHTLFVFSC